MDGGPGAQNTLTDELGSWRLPAGGLSICVPLTGGPGGQTPLAADRVDGVLELEGQATGIHWLDGQTPVIHSLVSQASGMKRMTCQ